MLPGSDARYLRRRVRDALPAWRAIGASPVVLQWLTRGVPVCFTAPVPAFHHGECELQGAALDAWQVLRAHYLKSGALEPARRKRWVSRAFLVPKADGGFRLVVDLRHINSFTRQLKCKYECLKVIARQLHVGDWLYKLDVRDAYHHVPIPVHMRDYFVFCINGEYFRCAALPFGWTNSPFYFTKVMREVVRFVRSATGPVATSLPPWLEDIRSRLGGNLSPYLDDFLGSASTESAAARAAVAVAQLFHKLGILVHDKKSILQPGQRVEHLGMLVDTVAGMFEVTGKRVGKVVAAARQLLGDVSRHSRWVNKRDLAKFTGLAQSTRLGVPYCMLYLREMYNCFATCPGWGSLTRVRLTHQAVRDLRWWAGVANRVLRAELSPPPARALLTTDASSSAWGAVLRHPELPGPQSTRGAFVGPLRAAHITLKELTAVRLGVLSWASLLHGQVLQLHSDNQPVVDVLTQRASRSPALMAEIRQLQRELDRHGIHFLKPCWVPTHENEADHLTRLLDRDDWKINPAVYRHLERVVGRHSLDGFATAANRQCRQFIAGRPQPGALAVDFFATPPAVMHGHRLWLNPPWSELDNLTTWLERNHVPATVIAPLWPAQPWYPRLMALADRAFFIPASDRLFLPYSGEYLGPPGWATMAISVHGSKRATGCTLRWEPVPVPSASPTHCQPPPPRPGWQRCKRRSSARWAGRRRTTYRHWPCG